MINKLITKQREIALLKLVVILLKRSSYTLNSGLTNGFVKRKSQSMEHCIKDTSPLLGIVVTFSEDPISNCTTLLNLDILKSFTCIDNQRRIQAVH